MRCPWVLGFFIIMVLMLPPPAQGATRMLTVDCQGRPGGGGWGAHPACRHAFSFALEVLSDPWSMSQGYSRGRPILYVREGQTYSVRLVNPLPVSVAVNLSVDGLNTITGRPGSPADGAKWVLGPHSSAVIDGWQVGAARARQFVFTSKHSSYASYRSGAFGRDLTVNCGVIGAAFFWSSAELARCLDHAVADVAPGGVSFEPPSRPGERVRRMGHPVAPAAQFQAGTGQGVTVCRPVRSVDFHFDSGMFRSDEALVVFYDFSPRSEEPYGSPERAGHRRHDQGHFAPEMPRAWQR